MAGVALAVIVANSKTPTAAETAALVQKQQMWQQRAVEEVRSRLIYFKDDRTGLCFAYYWGGAANGGPALTVVPEENVKEFLIK